MPTRLDYPVHIAFGDETRFQTTIQHDGRWQRMDIPRPCDRAVAIEQNRKGQGVAREEAAYGAVSLGHADGNDRKRPVVEPRVHLAEACHFRAARLAPGGEEMNEDDPTAKLRKLVLGAVQARQNE